MAEQRAPTSTRGTKQVDMVKRVRPFGNASSLTLVPICAVERANQWQKRAKIKKTDFSCNNTAFPCVVGA